MILCSGCFDGLHAGHIRYLEAARLLSTEGLFVCVAPDEYILSAKNRKPYWIQVDRCKAVQALRCVSHAWCENEITLAHFIERWAPMAFVKGVEWAGRLPEDVETACRKAKTLIVFVDTPGRHVSETR